MGLIMSTLLGLTVLFTGCVIGFYLRDLFWIRAANSVKQEMRALDGQKYFVWEDWYDGEAKRYFDNP